MPERPTHPNPPAAVTAAAPPVEAVGDDIGPYRLLAVLGQGGFGVVYLAERRTPFVQRVALKVIKPGMDSAAVIARFEQERQTLAVLDHPHIARVFDAGATPLGRPYFVMEHVAGEQLVTYCDRHALGVEARLGVFAQVCDAVQHAHQRGLIHRDLKPGNVLVAEHDGQPHAKVIDFGVAKALAHTHSEKAYTVQGQAIGTPEYMSPEQALGEPPDARTDVYSLGVMLFELLTGELPFDSAALKGKAAADLARLIPDLPARPLSALRPELRGDLETIVLRATSREKQRRYESAAELGAEVRRYLGGDPIAARRDSVMYVVGTRAKRAARARPLATLALVWLLAAVVAQFVIVPLVYRWTPLWAAYERAASAIATQISPAPGLSHVRVVSISDAHPPDELARLAGLTGDPPPGLRAVHGAAMKRLARANPSCVAWDIIFQADNPELDPALLEGFDALEAAGVPWVVLVDWTLDPSVTPALTSALKTPKLRCGGASMETGGREVYFTVFASRGQGEPQPSLALQVLGALQLPGVGTQLELTPVVAAKKVRVDFWRPDAVVGGTRPRPREGFVVPLSAVAPAGTKGSTPGIRPDDTLGLLSFRVPPDAELDAARVEYADMLAADDATLRRWFGGKVVLVGDFRRGPQDDYKQLPDGRQIAGASILSTGIDRLITKVIPVIPSPTQAAMLTAGAAAAGVVLGAVWRGRWKRRLCACAAAAVCMILATLALYIGGVVCNPAVPVFALLVGCELAAWLGLPAGVGVRGAV